MLSALAARLTGRAPLAEGVVLIASPASSADDFHTLLIAAVLHSQGQLRLSAIICSGGLGAPRAEASARLARCLLAQLGVDVPVGIGTDAFVRADADSPPDASVEHAAKLIAALAGTAAAALDDAAAFPNGQTLALAVLHAAPERSVSFVCLSSLRDLADLLELSPRLCACKVSDIIVSGAVRYAQPADGAAGGGGWVPDERAPVCAENPAAAATVFDFCLRQGRGARAAHGGVPLSVVAAEAVPPIPLQLARSFAARSREPLMRALAAGQAASLERLWARCCSPAARAGCDRRWFYRSVCGLGEAEADDLLAAELVAATAKDEEEQEEAAGQQARQLRLHVQAHSTGGSDTTPSTPSGADSVDPTGAQLATAVAPCGAACLLLTLRAYAHVLPACEAVNVARQHRLFLSARHRLPGAVLLRLLRDCYHAAILLAFDARPALAAAAAAQRERAQPAGVAGDAGGRASGASERASSSGSLASAGGGSEGGGRGPSISRAVASLFGAPRAPPRSSGAASQAGGAVDLASAAAAAAARGPARGGVRRAGRTDDPTAPPRARALPAAASQGSGLGCSAQGALSAPLCLAAQPPSQPHGTASQPHGAHGAKKPRAHTGVGDDGGGEGEGGEGSFSASRPAVQPALARRALSGSSAPGTSPGLVSRHLFGARPPQSPHRLPLPLTGGAAAGRPRGLGGGLGGPAESGCADEEGWAADGRSVASARTAASAASSESEATAAGGAARQPAGAACEPAGSAAMSTIAASECSDEEAEAEADEDWAALDEAALLQPTAASGLGGGCDSEGEDEGEEAEAEGAASAQQLGRAAQAPLAGPANGGSAKAARLVRLFDSALAEAAALHWRAAASLGLLGLLVFAAAGCGQLRVQGALAVGDGFSAAEAMRSDLCALLNAAGVTAVLLSIQPTPQFLVLARAAALALWGVHSAALLAALVVLARAAAGGGAEARARCGWLLFLVVPVLLASLARLGRGLRAHWADARGLSVALCSTAAFASLAEICGVCLHRLSVGPRARPQRRAPRAAASCRLLPPRPARAARRGAALLCCLLAPSRPRLRA